MKNPILPDMSDVLHLMSDVLGGNVGQIVRHLSFVDDNRLDVLRLEICISFISTVVPERNQNLKPFSYCQTFCIDINQHSTSYLYGLEHINHNIY